MVYSRSIVILMGICGLVVDTQLFHLGAGGSVVDLKLF